MKVRLLAIPSKAAPLVNPDKPAHAEKVIRQEITQALAEIASCKVQLAPPAKNKD